MSEGRGDSPTLLRRIEQYRDRWTSYGANTGIVALSDKLSPDELRELELFRDYDDAFLERISPDVSVAVWREGSVLFEEGTYIDLAFHVVKGEVEVWVASHGSLGESRPIFDLDRTGILNFEDLAAAEAGGTQVLPSAAASMRLGSRVGSAITMLATMDFDLPRGSGVRLGPGEIFGEIGALSGWPQSVTARTTKESRLVQIRLPALRAMRRKSKGLRARLDELYRERSLAAQLEATPLCAGFGRAALEGLSEVVELLHCEPGETVVREGEAVGALYLVRSGFLRLLQRYGEGELAVSYLSKGMTLGDVELVTGLDRWQESATSVEHAELVRIPRESLELIVRAQPQSEQLLWGSAVARIKEAGRARRDLRHSEFTQVALDSGLVQGSSILVIDLERCTRCDDCVRACAATHGGRPRFVREGDKIQNLLVARSCYHCRDPVCLVGCPTGAIHRAGVADVVEIDDEVCIGCSTCANNCPYDAIVMHETGEAWPDDMVPTGLRGRPRRVASKCDLCHDRGHEPACVTNCPQACAFRVGSVEDLRDLLTGEEE
jgi:Fe-S-cluster-containing dehydrogenase component